MLCSSTDLLCSILCSCKRSVLSPSAVFVMRPPPHLCLKFDYFVRVYSLVSKICADCSIRVYLKFQTLQLQVDVLLEYIIIDLHNHILVKYILLLALCLMLLATYYAQNDAGIIGWSLIEILLTLNIIY